MPRQFKTVLCGTDFSEPSYQALEYGVRFAKAAEGRLVVVHSVHVPTGEVFTDTRFTMNFQDIENHAQDLMHEIHASRLESYPNTEMLVEIGEPAEVLLKMARERPADLIVTATRGRSGLQQLVMGSVAEKVIRHAPCPVFVVPSGGR